MRGFATRDLHCRRVSPESEPCFVEAAFGHSSGRLVGWCSSATATRMVKARDKFRTMFTPLCQYGSHMDFSDHDIEVGVCGRRSSWRFSKKRLWRYCSSRRSFRFKIHRRGRTAIPPQKHREGSLTIIWVPVSRACTKKRSSEHFRQHCRLQTIREMPKGERDAAWKKVCQRVKEALIARERPAINTALEGHSGSKEG